MSKSSRKPVPGVKIGGAGGSLKPVRERREKRGRDWGEGANFPSLLSQLLESTEVCRDTKLKMAASCFSALDEIVKNE